MRANFAKALVALHCQGISITDGHTHKFLFDLGDDRYEVRQITQLKPAHCPTGYPIMVLVGLERKHQRVPVSHTVPLRSQPPLSAAPSATSPGRLRPAKATSD